MIKLSSLLFTYVLIGIVFLINHDFRTWGQNESDSDGVEKWKQATYAVNMSAENAAGIDNPLNEELINQSGNGHDYLLIDCDTSVVISPIACNNYTSPSGKIFTSSGTYTDTVRTPTGACDTSFTIHLTIIHSTSSAISPYRCSPYISPSGKYIWTTSGTYMDTIPNAAGCDSVITIHLIVADYYYVTISPFACHSYTSPSGTYTWTESGTYKDTIFNTTSCDTAFTIQLKIQDSSNIIEISRTVCDSFISPTGKYVWTESGTYYDTIPNPTGGCDAIFIIELKVNHSTFDTISSIVCGSYISPSGIEWNTSGTYTDIIPNSVGCDSIITINLTVNHNTSSTIPPTICGSYTSPSGKIWAEDGTYTDTIPNAAGCDSVITINLSVNHSTSDTISAIDCGTYISPGGKKWETSGTYMDTIPNAVGCDSFITVNLTVYDEINDSVTVNGDTLTANADSASYRWIDCRSDSLIAGATGQSFIPTENGEYAVIISQNGCIDTSDCVAITTVSTEEPDFHEMLVYPNPTTGRLTIQLDKIYADFTLQITDISGKKVKEIHFSDKMIVNFQLEIPPGIYFIRVKTSTGTISKKFIIEE